MRAAPSRRSLLRLALFALILFARPTAAESAKPSSSDDRSLFVLDFKPTDVTDTGPAKLVTAAFTQAIRQVGVKSKILSQEELGAHVETKILSQLTGCEDDKCVADASKALAVDNFISGRVGVVGDQRLVFVSLIDSKTGSVKGRASGSFPAGKGDLLAQGKELAKQLFNPETESATGEVLSPLSEMRLALLVDEYDQNDKALLVKTLDACLAQHLSDSNARLVSADQVARIKRIADPKVVLQAGVGDALDGADVDLLATGVVKYSPGPEMMGFVSASADMTLQLIQVDTGEVVVTAQESGRGPGASGAIANRAAALQLCGTVNDELMKALDKRRDRGKRLVVTVSGTEIGADGAAEIVEWFKKLPRVAAARLRKASDSGATVDVSVSGGDGVLLALEIKHANLPLKVTDAGPAALKLTRTQ